MTPTDEQVAIVDAARRGENLMVTAMAGCAKTTTLEMIANALPIRPSLYVVFNAKNKKEAEKRMPSHFDVKTANGVGHAAWARAIGKRLTLDDRKIGNIVKEIIKSQRISSTADEFADIIRLVRRARIMGMMLQNSTYKGLLDDTPDNWELIGDSIYMDPSDEQIWIARLALKESIRQAYQGVIDFDDQIYMSSLFGGVFAKYPVVLVDETQDLNPLNHIQVSKSSPGQLGLVGDPRQAIYAFRGADSASMANMRGLRDVWTDLPLSTTFRCPKVVVSRQQSHAPGFNAAPTNPDGEFIAEKGPWQIGTHLNGNQISLLCRNNAPLIGTALRLIAKGHGCSILGRELGKGLAKLLKDICNQGGPATEAIRAINDWATQEVSKAVASGKEGRAALIQDKADCLVTVLSHENITSVEAGVQALEKMFSADEMRITLSTGHKAKGLEWDTVIHLDSWRIPSKYAKAAQANGDPVPYEQDMNLQYVIETRTKNRLVLADTEQLQ